MGKTLVFFTTIALTISPAAAQAVYTGPGAYYTFGTTTLSPTGAQQRLGNTTLTPEGAYSTFGNTTLGPNGSMSTQIGKTTLSNDGDGHTVICNTIGKIMLCN